MRRPDILLEVWRQCRRRSGFRAGAPEGPDVFGVHVLVAPDF